MVKVYVCYAMTCIGLCDVWVRVTHELYGDLGITSGQYASRDTVWQLSLPGMWYGLVWMRIVFDQITRRS